MSFHSFVGFAVLIVLPCLVIVQTSGIKVPLKAFTTTESRIRSHGYPAETHFIETDDGYVLQVFRIPYSHKLGNKNDKRPAILLQHGLTSNSDCWINSGPDNSLAYMLADAGYDVWLGNARGNIYSKHHIKISLKHPNFWNFSWHEIAIYDIANMIDYILEKTGESAIHYAGHSQGTTVYMVLLSERPEYNKKIKTGHLLAPCAFFRNGKSAVFDIFGSLVGTPDTVWTSLLENMELLPQNDILNRLIDTSCGTNPSMGSYCKNSYFWLLGGGYTNTNVSSLQILLETHPGGASSNQGIHYIQLANNGGHFRQYDHGAKKNQQRYNRPTPPDYDLTRINAKTYLYSSANDALCDPQDVNTLVTHLPQADDYRIPDPSFNHLDFIVAFQIREYINERLIGKVNEFENKK